MEFGEAIPFSVKIYEMKKYPLHWHDGVTEVVLPLKGSVEITSNVENRLINEGDFLFVNNKAIHSIVSAKGAIVAIFHINLSCFEKHFENIRYMSFRNNMLLEDPEKVLDSSVLDNEMRQEYNLKFRNLLISILEEMERDRNLSKKVLQKYEYRLGYSMVYEFNWLQFLRTSKDFISSIQLDRFHRIIKYIDEHYAEKITLSDIVAKEYISKSYLSHIWKNVSSYSFQERINYERVVKSVFLLLSGNMSISGISEMCGFSDVKYYYQNFKRWYGCMPLRYRQKWTDYAKSGSDFKELKLQEIHASLTDYKNKYFLNQYYHECHPDIFVSLERLIREGNSSLRKKNIVIEILGKSSCHIENQEVVFNFHKLDLCQNFSVNLDLLLQIKIDCDTVEQEILFNAVNKFLEKSFYRYGEKAVSKWHFSICFNEQELFDTAKTLGEILNRKIRNVKMSYYIEV